MSGIKKRTIFVEVQEPDRGKPRYHRPADWAKVDTDIGSMAEPFLWAQRYEFGTAGACTRAIDFEDDMARVDEILFVPSADVKNELSSFSDKALTGGFMHPRSGR